MEDKNPCFFGLQGFSSSSPSRGIESAPQNGFQAFAFYSGPLPPSPPPLPPLVDKMPNQHQVDPQWRPWFGQEINSARKGDKLLNLLAK